MDAPNNQRQDKKERKANRKGRQTLHSGAGTRARTAILDKEKPSQKVVSKS
jgi:hypothetical protein